MENLHMLVECTEDLQNILGLFNKVLNLIKYAIPILLIVLGTLDIAKVVTAGEGKDDDVKKATKKFTTRVIYAVVIFLIPTIISVLFDLVTLPGADVSIIDCMKGNVTN